MKPLLTLLLFISSFTLSAQQPPAAATIRIQLTFQPDSGFSRLPCHVYLADDDTIPRVFYIGTTGYLDTVIPYTEYLSVVAWADGFLLRHEYLHPVKGAALFADTINLAAGTADPAVAGFGAVCPGCDNSPVYRYILDYVNAHPADKCEIMWQCDAMQEKHKTLIAESKQFMEAEIPKVKKLGVDEKRVSFSSLKKFESLGCGMALQGKTERELKQRFYGVVFTSWPPAPKTRGRKP